MTILILGSSEDVHAQSVASQLDRIGAQFRFLHFSDLVQSGTLTYQLNSNALLVRKSDGTEINFADVTAIWNRRSGYIEAATMPESWVESLIENESNRAMAGVLRTLQCLWVNHPASQQECLYKVHQLRTALHVGLTCPETIITNDPQEVRDFYESSGGQVIYKPIDESTYRNFPVTEWPRGIPTVPLLKEDLPYLEQVRHCLHLFQRKVDKIADVRVTIVGEEVFAARIESQQGKGKIDFRLDYSVPVVSWQLPPHVAAAALKLMRTLGLNFGALDFCLEGSGEHVFLEVNPAGQFLWLEEALEMPISAALAGLLHGNGRPLV